MNDNGLGVDNPAMMSELAMMALLKNALFPTPTGGDGEPKPINPALQNLVLTSAVSNLLSVGFPDPEGDDHLIHGPHAPVIRDILVALGVAQLAGGLTDGGMRRKFQGMAANAIGEQAQRLAKAVG